jgi:molybdopterin-guanine dinucleotide biosynthesis protein B
MRVLSVCGITGSGKTTTIENIIKELRARGYKVGSVKDIHFEAFKMDPDPTTNTNRHKAAGATLVTALGYFETAILYPIRLPLDSVLDFYEKDDYDWVVLEGVDCIAVPTIVTAHNAEDLEQKWVPMAFAVSGIISASITEYQDKPSIDSTTDITKLTDLIELKVYDRLPNFPPECCMACGMTCEQLAHAIIAGEKRRSDCIADQGIELYCNGRRVMMVPFVQNLLKNALLGVVSELEGYEKGCEINVRLSDNPLQIQEE